MRGRNVTPVAGTAVLACLAACISPASARADGVPWRVESYDIRVRIDPAEHAIRGEATLRFQVDAGPAAQVPAFPADLTLNQALKIERFSGENLMIRDRPGAEGAVKGNEGRGEEKLHSTRPLEIELLGEDSSLTVVYSGKLVQDVDAGERPGQIHNFLMAAHIGPEGIYLDGGGGWYPRVAPANETDAPPALSKFSLTVEPVADMRLVAGADFDRAASEKSGQLVWRSKYPLDGLALVGGPHAAKTRSVDGIELAIHYSVPDAADAANLIDRHTELFLDAAESYLQRYPPLIGPYPFGRFTIVENFFSSGFAFPEFTLLNKVLLKMGPRALMHGYLDHELLHSWWGNSIYVDPRDGNWCEALTSYAANYYGHVLDGDAAGARNQRRNYCVTLSTIRPEEDKPLDTFGRADGVGRDVGYGKGAMVFHMLSRRIGQDTFWSALRKLTAQYTGKHASWQTLQTLFEGESGADLGRFFQEWVRSGGTPRIELAAARWIAADNVLEVQLKQHNTTFALDVPIQVRFDAENGDAAGNAEERTIRLDGPEATVRLDLDAAPGSVVLDPDYQVLRKLGPGEIMPTSKITAADGKLLVIRPAGELAPFYRRVVDAFRGDDVARKVVEVAAGEIGADQLASGSLLVLGSAVRDEAVQALLARTSCPIAWDNASFQIGETRFDQPGHAVLCTVHHPDAPGSAITVYFGNSETALGRSDLLMFYRNSLVVFETTAKKEADETTYESRVIERRDFESPQVVEVVR